MNLSWVHRRACNLRLALCFTIASALPLAAGQTASTDSPEIDRLVAVAKTWATVKYFHPYLANRPIDWDKALLEALPGIRSARDAAEYKSAVNAMLSALGDPLTRALSPGETVALPSDLSPQRARIHYGLRPHSQGWHGFYSGVIERSAGPVAVMSQPLGAELTASIRLSETTQTGTVFPLASQPDRDYAEDAFPSTELRLLGAFRLWGAVHYFYAYKDLMDEDWAAAFARLLPKFLAAKDALAYHLAVSELAKTLADTHATVESTEIKRYLGESPVGLRIRLIDRKPVVTDVLDEEAKAKGIHVGDLVTRVDGESLPDRVRRQASYISASTQQGLGTLVCARVLNGKDAAPATLSVGSPDGTTKEVTLMRNSSYLPALATQRTGAVVRLLPGKVGYLDMDRLEESGVAAAFDRLRDTTGLIVDLRGRFLPDVRPIASRLTSRSNATALLVNGPVLLEPDGPHAGSDSYSASYFSSTIIPTTNLPKYKGKIVALIDERTADRAEEAALFLEAATKVQFVGTPSAGVIGATTDLALPGGLVVSFSGQDVRHSNGGPLQRLGIQPNISVPPTVAAIREGRDEALTRALETFKEE
jgi:C-terminal processing protease CtpA/Prc